MTADEIADPQPLSLGLDLNGASVQVSSTADMIIGVAEIIAYLSRFMSLAPGDLIATDTPDGVGMGMTPQRWLRPGDAMRAHVEALGEQRRRVRAPEA